MQQYGFHFAYRLGGGDPTIQDLLFKDTETLTKGDLVNLETGEVDLAATDDAALLGAVLETISGTDSTTRIKVITDSDAVYAVYDANARLVGATLDISGTTGQMTVGATSNADLTVVSESSATEPTLVMITHGEHAFN
jgi:hypothetical protein